MKLSVLCTRCRIAASVAGGVLLAGLPAGRAADGPALFADNCASCHGPDGKAQTPAGKKVHAKDLTVSRLNDAAILQQIKEGYRDSHGLPAMPAFKGRLSDEEVNALLPVVKSFRK